MFFIKGFQRKSRCAAMQCMRRLFLFILLHSTLAHSQQTASEPTDLVILRANWNKARNQAVAPIDQKYLKALEALKLTFTRDGKLKEALLVEAEIESISASLGSKSPSPAKASTKLSQTVLCKDVWSYHIPAEGRSWRYEFLKDRKVLVDSSNFGTWEISNNTLRIEGLDNRLWIEFSVDVETTAQGGFRLREVDSSKGKRESVTLTQE